MIGCQLGFQRGGRNLHEFRGFGPEQRGPDRPLGIKFGQYRPVQRELADVAPRRLGGVTRRGVVGLEIDDQDLAFGDHEAGDARAHYLVGLDLLEGQYIKRDNALGFAYLVLATEDKQWGDLVAPRAREARAVVEPQLSGQDLIHADALIAAYKQRKK